MVLAVEWVDTPEPRIRLLDQTALPASEVHLDISTVDALVDAIQTLAVRGAPALGAVGALGVVVAMNQAVREGWDEGRLQREIDRIRTARPTAVNLAWGEIGRATCRERDIVVGVLVSIHITRGVSRY